VSSRPPYGQTVAGNDWSSLDGRQPEVPPSVSVIIVHFEQHDDLARTLVALEAQTHPATLTEIIVVDDGSKVAPTVPQGVRLIVQQDLGFRASAARNAGAAAATGAVLCFLDADMMPEPGYVAAMVRLPALAPEAVTVGRRRHAELSGSTPGEPVDASIRLSDPDWLTEAYAASRDLLDSDERSYRYLIGAVLACSAWFFDEIGGFDEGFTSYGGEDWEWAHRAWLAGAVFAHVPEAVAWHNGPDAAVRDLEDPVGALVTKNLETVALLSLIAVPGATGRGIAAAAPDVLISVPSGEPAAIYRCVDSLLHAAPAARIEVDAAYAGMLGHDSRIGFDGAGGLFRSRVEVSRLFRVSPGDVGRFHAVLTDACTRVGRGTLGAVVIAGQDGIELVVSSSRALARTRRWGDAERWDTERVEFPLQVLEPGASLAAYLGGWGD